MTCVGILYIIVGRASSKKLDNLKKSKISESSLKAEFRKASVQTKGALTMPEFKNLIRTLGLDLNRREAEAAYLQLDSRPDGVVGIDQFLAWWKDCDNDDAADDGHLPISLA
jgi:Ca2+-binding EF-hand superfamily protein